MFVWSDRTSMPDYSHEMLHYRNAMVKEINFIFSDKYNKLTSNSQLQNEFEKFKDIREKTGNRITDESVRNKIWVDLLLELFKSSLDFTAADLYIKYFFIPNDTYHIDFYFHMKETGSPYNQLIKENAFKSAFGFLHFFQISDALLEFEHLLKTAIKEKNDRGLLYLLDHIIEIPYDKLLKDDETKKMLGKYYESAEKERKIVEARKIADVLKDPDKQKRTAALDAMINNNHRDAVEQLKSIRDKKSFKPTVKEFYLQAMQKGKQSKDMDEYRIAYAYAVHGQLSENGDKNLIQEPAGKLFEYCVTKPGASEVDFYEADKYRNDCNEKLVRDAVAIKMLELIQNIDGAKAKHVKKRFMVEFKDGDYKSIETIKKHLRTLTETYGVYDVPKGEETLLTALDIAELYEFSKSEIEAVKVLLCKFFLMHKKFDKAKKYYLHHNRELYELIVKQINSFIKANDFEGAYGIITAIPLRLDRADEEEVKKTINSIAGEEESSFKDLATAITLDDIYELRELSKLFYTRTFTYGLNGGADGIQFLVDLEKPFSKHMDACSKFGLTHMLKNLIATDKISADLLNQSYGKFTHPDIFDYFAYFFKKLFGRC